MRRQFKIVPLLVMLVACAIVGLWQTQARRAASSEQSFSLSAPASRPHADVTIRTADGSFVMKDLTLKRMGSSTILKGEVFNKQAHRANQATFEVRAYDRTGTLLCGVEEKNMFTVHQLKAHASAPLNSGYGVWLQGIPLDHIARLEVIEAGGETARSSLARFVPFASHALDWKRYSEIEE